MKYINNILFITIILFPSLIFCQKITLNDYIESNKNFYAKVNNPVYNKRIFLKNDEILYLNTGSKSHPNYINTANSKHILPINFDKAKYSTPILIRNYEEDVKFTDLVKIAFHQLAKNNAIYGLESLIYNINYLYTFCYNLQPCYKDHVNSSGKTYYTEGYIDNSYFSNTGFEKRKYSYSNTGYYYRWKNQSAEELIKKIFRSEKTRNITIDIAISIYNQISEDIPLDYKKQLFNIFNDINNFLSTYSYKLIEYQAAVNYLPDEIGHNNAFIFRRIQYDDLSLTSLQQQTSKVLSVIKNSFSNSKNSNILNIEINNNIIISKSLNEEGFIITSKQTNKQILTPRHGNDWRYHDCEVKTLIDGNQYYYSIKVLTNPKYNLLINSNCEILDFTCE